MCYFLTVFFHFTYSFGSSSLEARLSTSFLSHSIFLDSNIRRKIMVSETLPWRRSQMPLVNVTGQFAQPPWNQFVSNRSLNLPSELFCQSKTSYFPADNGHSKKSSLSVYIPPGIIAFLTPASSVKWIFSSYQPSQEAWNESLHNQQYQG